MTADEPVGEGEPHVYDAARPASPCVRNCCLDEHDICLGCHRSLEEICAWSAAGADERRAILERAARRARSPGRRLDAR